MRRRNTKATHARVLADDILEFQEKYGEKISPDTNQALADAFTYLVPLTGQAWNAVEQEWEDK